MVTFEWPAVPVDVGPDPETGEYPCHDCGFRYTCDCPGSECCHHRPGCAEYDTGYCRAHSH
jgi:hypothetical protein